MRIIALALIAATLVPVAAHARRPQPAPVAVAIDDVNLAVGAAPVERILTAGEYAASGGRITLDVRFGPADSTIRRDGATVSTWRFDAEARDSSMRVAGIGRITVVQTPTAVRVTFSPIARLAAPVVMASVD